MIYTIGYQQRKPEELVDVLKQNGVRILIDVRKNPRSRIPHYSKTRLSKLLNDNQIKYIHSPELGTPKWMRNKFYKNKDFRAFFSEFRDYFIPRLRKGLSSRIKALFGNNETQPVCMFCYEREYQQCHRSVITETLVREFQWQVKHL